MCGHFWILENLKSEIFQKKKIKGSTKNVLALKTEMFF